MYRINYAKPITFGRMRGFTGKELTKTLEGRKYLRWALRSNLWVSNCTRDFLYTRGRVDYTRSY